MIAVRLPNGSVPVSDIKDAVVRDRIMKMNENIVYLEKMLQSIMSASAKNGG